ncbi:hypothetical protein [Steroidobacter sp.]|uniref:hypothetical protein n=1 Tax=Steroidobacter sp. TaxID=1978227 RepID=UPI001A562B68|nr:hypothetical protein [Steroidobacter sp.]MBL8264937.1 hypothetical protein [Steroidobacter sp.]
MTEPTDKQLPDAQLDEYLKGDSDVSRQYRSLHEPSVPAELDLLVLREAEAAVKPRSTRNRPAWVRWAAPLAVAASAVVVLSIVVETGLRDETMVMQSPAPALEMKRRERAEGSVADLPPASPKAEVQAPTPVYIEPATETPLADMVMQAPAFESPAPAPAAVPEPAPPPAAVVAPEEDAFARQSANSVAAEAREDERSADAVAAAGIQASAAAAEKQLQAVSAAKRVREEVRAAAPSRSVVSTEMKRAYTDPEEWLKDIRQLRKDDKQTEADAEWQRFLAAFPNYPVAETDKARAEKK